MKKIYKIMIAVVAAIALVFCVYKYNAGSTTKYDGSVEVEVINIDGKEIAEETINYNDGDKFADLVEENFDNVTIDNGMLMTIETLTTPEDYSTYISILVDGEYSEVGINDIDMSQYKTITFEEVENTYAQ